MYWDTIICSINFHLSKLSTAKFSILYDISLVRNWKRKLKLITLGSERVNEGIHPKVYFWTDFLLKWYCFLEFSFNLMILKYINWVICRKLHLINTYCFVFLAMHIQKLFCVLKFLCVKDAGCSNHCVQHWNNTRCVKRECTWGLNIWIIPSDAPSKVIPRIKKIISTT